MKNAKPRSLRKPSLAEEIGFVFDVRARAQTLAEGSAGSFTTLEVLQWTVNAERFMISQSNATIAPGRPVKKEWSRRLGMDPVDALVLKELLALLGHPHKPSAFNRFIIAHAITKDGGEPQGDRTQRLASDASLDRQIKRFFEDTPRSLRIARDSQIAKLAQDREGFMAEVEAISKRASIQAGKQLPA